MKTLKRTMQWAVVGAFLLCSVALAQTKEPENKAPEDTTTQATEPENKAPEDTAKPMAEPENKAPEDTAKQAAEPEEQGQAPEKTATPSAGHKAGWDVNDFGVPRKMDKWDICEHESHYVPSKPDEAAYKIQMDCMAGK